MKILKEGKLKEPKPEFWVGFKLFCGRCDAELELEESDSPGIYSERSLTGVTTISVNCPCCNFTATRTIPNQQIKP